VVEFGREITIWQRFSKTRRIQQYVVGEREKGTGSGLCSKLLLSTYANEIHSPKPQHAEDFKCSSIVPLSVESHDC